MRKLCVRFPSDVPHDLEATGATSSRAAATQETSPTPFQCFAERAREVLKDIVVEARKTMRLLSPRVLVRARHGAHRNPHAKKWLRRYLQ